MSVFEKPKAIVFDWDDTIISAWHIIHAAINDTLVAMGEKPWTDDEARERIGPPAKVLFAELFGEENCKKADEIYINSYQTRIKDHIKAHDGAEDLLKFANDNDIYCTIASTKRGSILRKETQELGFDKYFKHVVGTGDAEQDKPAKEIVTRSLEGSGIDPEKDNVWFIGDGITDLKCAKNSGCKAVFVETKLPPEDQIAEYTLLHRCKDIEAVGEYLKAGLGNKNN